MAKTADVAKGFMNALDAPTAAQQGREASDVQAAIDADHGGFKLKPWDWELYAERVRKAKYDLDENETKPYLEIWSVLENGVFYAANQMYGVTFKRRTDIPTFQPDIRVYEAFDADGKPLGLAYFDYWKRDNKAGGAWMNSFVRQSKLLGTLPVISNTANFTKPAPGQPALITFEDVRTMFHEFGHGLHGLFASQTYPSLSGTSVARDFVEFPSQFNEHWALEPRVLAHYAKAYRTGAPMPQTLVDKIKRADTFGQGFTFGELLAAAQLDMAWHSLGADAPKQDVDAFEAKALAATGLDVTDVPPRYRSSYFAHIWGSGYAAGYYAYIWTDMLQQNVYDWFESHGGMTRANGQRFRDRVLSRGHTEDYGVMFRDMVGHDPEVGSLARQARHQREIDAAPLSASCSGLLVNDAAFHHESDVAKRLDVRGRIALHGDEVGEQAFMHAAEAIALAQDLRADRRRSEQGLGRRHAVPHHPVQLAPVFAVWKHAHVRAAAYDYAELQRQPERPLGVAHRRRRRRLPVDVVLEVGRGGLDRRQRRLIGDAFGDHQPERRFRTAVAMLDCIDARLGGAAHALVAGGVHSDGMGFGVRRLHRRLQFGFGEGGLRLAAGSDAVVGVELDPVGAQGRLLAHGLNDLVHTRRFLRALWQVPPVRVVLSRRPVGARGDDRPGRDEQARAGNDAVLNRPLQADIGVARAPRCRGRAGW